MRHENNGKWMLWMIMVAALVTPGIVVAGESHMGSAPTPAIESLPVSTHTGMDVLAIEQLQALTPRAASCHQITCNSNRDCQTTCDDITARCILFHGGDLPFRSCYIP